MVLVLIAAAGLNAPLALCAVSLAALNGFELQPEFGWLASPWVLAGGLVWLALQLYADLYFVPITVKDWRYLHPRRTHNAYLHARVQSLLRPLCAALVVAAVPLPMVDWEIALLGFCGAAAVYWLSAWIREFVARTRGTLVLIALETAKNVLLVPLVMLAFWLPLVAVMLLAALLAQTALWSWRLQREYRLYAHYGGHRAREDA
jgi:hypothetical protein